jgi:hypothetical protein
MSKRMIPSDVPEIKANAMSSLTKWVPLICAGAAVGVSIIALKELKNVRKEMLLKIQPPPQNDDLIKRIQAMDEQLMKITQYLKNNPKTGTVVKNAKKIPKEPVKIINEESEEYEEVEVTDSESED